MCKLILYAKIYIFGVVGANRDTGIVDIRHFHPIYQKTGQTVFQKVAYHF